MTPEIRYARAADGTHVACCALAVRDLVAGSGITSEDAGIHVLKGIPEERQLYRVASV